MKRLGNLVLAVLVALPAAAGAQESSDIKPLIRCQRKIARAGSTYANRTVRYTLRCTNEISECQINCENGVYGPPCGENPPPCCDPNDPGSNAQYADCLDNAQEICDKMDAKTVAAEQHKRDAITRVCSQLTTEQLCGASTPGLNFVTLNAGCEALIPGYECNLENFLDCVGGPLQKQLAEQMSALLDPRAPEAIALIPGLDTQITGIPIARKVSGSLAPGKADVWALDGTAEDPVKVLVRLRDDNGNGTSNLEPVLTYIGTDGVTPVPNVSFATAPCNVPNVCGRPCPQFKRRFPFTGTYFIKIQASQANGCTGGDYQIVVVTPGGNVPTLIADDVNP